MHASNHTLQHLTESYRHCLDAEGKSQKTIDWYVANLRRFSRYLADNQLDGSAEDVRVTDARRFINHLKTDVRRWETSRYVRDANCLSPFSVQGYARTIKAFWSWLEAEGLIAENPMVRLKLPKVPKKIVTTFANDEIDRMLGLPDRRTGRGYRDYLIILVFLDTGIRLSELAALEVKNIDFSQSCFLVHGKGGKERVVPFGIQVRRTLRRYMGSFRPQPASPSVSRVFLSEAGYPLRPRGVQVMVTRLGKKAGITGKRCSPHTFRHTFALRYLMAGGDVFSLQRILGHSTLEVVKLYVNMLAADIAAQHRKFSPVDNLISRAGKTFRPL
jgi:site-specific recombinase XerD